MLDKNEGHAGVVGHCFEQGLIGCKSARRSADANDQMARRSGCAGVGCHHEFRLVWITPAR